MFPSVLVRTLVKLILQVSMQQCLPRTELISNQDTNLYIDMVFYYLNYFKETRVTIQNKADNGQPVFW